MCSHSFYQIHEILQTTTKKVQWIFKKCEIELLKMKNESFLVSKEVYNSSRSQQYVRQN